MGCVGDDGDRDGAAEQLVVRVAVGLREDDEGVELRVAGADRFPELRGMRCEVQLLLAYERDAGRGELGDAGG